MGTIAEGVDFDTIAREWRCKWSQGKTFRPLEAIKVRCITNNLILLLFAYTKENDKASLVAAQKALLGIEADIKKIDGLKGVQRIVCGGCMDFKVKLHQKLDHEHSSKGIVIQHLAFLKQVIVSLSAEKFGDWEKKNFAPESEFVAQLNSIQGLDSIETQTYTIMPVF